MNAPAQLEMFDPDAADATRLMLDYMREANRQADAADRFELLDMRGATAQAERAMADAVASALVLSIYLDLLELAA